MSFEQISERIRDHLTKQKAQSRGPNGCAYRGDGGVMCAVGCLITDDGYSPNIEDIGSDAVIIRDALIRSGVDVDSFDRKLLRDWQRYHDGMCSRGRGYSYTEWLNGDERSSPEAFHQFITKHYEKEQQSNERA